MNYNGQLAAWAIDRAIETAKLLPDDKRDTSPEEIVSAAKVYAEFAGDADKAYDDAAKLEAEKIDAAVQ